MSYELPPQPRGTAEQQLAALRDYLVRMAQELDRTGESETVITRIARDQVKASEEISLQTIQQQAQALKALIIKNAREIYSYADEISHTLQSQYVAISDYGNYYEDIETQVSQTARETVESYRYSEKIDSLNSFRTELNGQIRRGLMEDPETHEIHLGIAVSESLSFTGNIRIENGISYYELSPGQTLGLYTSRGWQFWINGVKRGWFDSRDSMLHVSNLVVEDSLQLGPDWTVTTGGGLGLRYTGG